MGIYKRHVNGRLPHDALPRTTKGGHQKTGLFAAFAALRPLLISIPVGRTADGQNMRAAYSARCGPEESICQLRFGTWSRATPIGHLRAHAVQSVPGSSSRCDRGCAQQNLRQ